MKPIRIIVAAVTLFLLAGEAYAAAYIKYDRRPDRRAQRR